MTFYERVKHGDPCVLILPGQPLYLFDPFDPLDIFHFLSRRNTSGNELVVLSMNAMITSIHKL